MAGAPNGTKQKTYYVREDLARVVAHLASAEDKRESDVVNEAFEHYVNVKLTEEQRRVFGYKKEKTNGHVNGTATDVTGRVRQAGSAALPGRKDGAPPGRPRADRPTSGVEGKEAK